MIGNRLGGRYDIEKKIGEGGMAVVYRARDILLNRTVAVKILRSQFGNDDDFITRFHREAQAAASLSHPHVVNIYDIGQEDDVYYIVMEYVEGETLKEYINEMAPLDVREAVNIAIQICDALDHAHQNHLIHRDIKPHNIMINKNGKIKVTDFGIARAVSAATITHTGSVLGSVHYFSPEQAKGVMTNAKSDLYSMGVVLYEMLTGQLPFSGDSPISVALKHLQEPYIHPRQLRPEIPQSLENVIIRALAKDPIYRYESAHEMLDDLKTCLSPERRNEPEYVLPEKYQQDDADITRVIPAIKPEMLGRRSWEDDTVPGPRGVPLDVKNNQGEEEDDPDEHRERHRKGLIKKGVIWAVGIGLFLLLSIVGSYYAMSLLNVPNVTVPAVEHLPVDQARKALEAQQLVAQITEQNDPTAQPGTVIKQTPAAKMQVKQKTVVQLLVSKGKQQTAMANYIGKKQSDIQSELSSYKKVTVDEVTNDQKDPGTILDQQPAPGQQIVPSDTELHLTISKGQDTVTMPNLIGLTQDEMQAKMDSLGLTANVKQVQSYQKQGIVIQQSYGAGKQLTKNSTVDVQVSAGMPQEARKTKVPVEVYLNPGEQADIEIRLTDATTSNETVEKTTINQSTRFDVTCVVSPTQNAIIQVFKNGAQMDQKIVKYTDIQ
ncbi:Stk1 family PASTA domain-containing Ser/Thr kinase [Aneurinibacillus sp. Ricciae_BoGa-3]|uniref:Stk1 family PASTA domain-containing Ser/Thr kinase n=1 Tax=Aneurinibacillus sp. Ricciae_BoGa-3 TaxID=3022697 RepID=UPI00233FB84D|nr:Stk1 family PASTA domain-containing Ser/Thr kinase [Aneurinibacillus sp. Ricciae_BoGa-3]WCK53034.1 Stk1 family PASTA domain-containing Ser/Thr kinase [Aneurinibacillus sp. Ricciae_BoGa-3]